MYPCRNLSTNHILSLSVRGQEGQLLGKQSSLLNLLKMSWFFVTLAVASSFSTTAPSHGDAPVKDLKLTPYLISIHLKLCQKMPFNSKWNSLVPGNIHRSEVGEVDPHSTIFNGSYYLCAMKSTPQILVFKPPTVSCQVPIPLPSPASYSHLSLRAQGQNEHAQVHLDSVGFEKTWPGCSWRVVPRKIL